MGFSYKDAQVLQISKRWKVEKCQSGENCWCRLIVTESPLLVQIKGVEEDLSEVVSSGSISAEIAEYLVELHNKTLEMEP